MILLWKKLVMHAFSFLIRTHLESWNIIKPTSGKGVAQCKDNQLVRCTRRIETTTEWLCMPILKNNTRKQIKDSPRSFFNLMRAHNLARKDSKKMLRAGKLRLTRESLGRIHGILLTTCDKQPDSIWNYNVQSQRHYFNSSFEDIAKSILAFPVGLRTWSQSQKMIELLPFNLPPLHQYWLKAFKKDHQTPLLAGEDQITYHHLKTLPLPMHLWLTFF